MEKDVDEVIMIMSNNLLAVERFDIGEGYDQKDFKKILRLKRISNKTTSEEVYSELNTLKNKYL